jgi:hypothetical protein
MSQPLSVVPDPSSEPPARRVVDQLRPGDHIVVIGAGPAGLTLRTWPRSGATA